VKIKHPLHCYICLCRLILVISFFILILDGALL
jgi:hypothetical protein